MSNLTTLKKSMTIPFMNISDTATEEWARIGKSTVFDLVLNANVATNNYIESDMPIDTVDYYKPTLSQELATIKGDGAFDYIYQMFFDLPTGTELEKTVLIAFAGNVGTEAEVKFNAWKVTATVILKDLNTVEGKILFDLNFGGNITKGTATVAENGTPTFTANAS